MKLFHVFAVFSSIVTLIQGFKVLGILPIGTKSHFAIGHSVVESLLNAGHSVTVISPYPQKKPIKNYTDIDVSAILEPFQNEKVPNPFTLGSISPMILMTFLYKLGGDAISAYMENPEIVKFMASGEKFDICVVEVFNTEAFMGIADHVGCDVVTYTTMVAVKWIDYMTSNQSPYSYVPNPFTSHTDNMTFSQRLHNTIFSHYENIAYSFYHLPNQRKLYQKYFPTAKKSFDEMHKSSAIIFVNSHVSSSSARPYLPNMIEIGGIHVKPSKPLPKDLQIFFDSATDGVILFSMGSIIQATQWPEDIREAFVKAFGKLNQKVLWKYESEILPNKPDNVMISPWIPQRDILAHPNVKLFITHGGLLGTTEALVEGVPVLGIPIFGDQKMNMAKAESRGYGLQISTSEVARGKLLEVLNEILSNPKYSENAKTIASSFLDRPMSPQEAVVYWTEYAYRHKGAPHLKAAGNSLNFIEFHLIDVYLAIFALAMIMIVIVFKLLSFSLGICFKKGQSRVLKEKSKKE